MTQRGLPVLERFMKYVWTEPNTSCWLWVGAAHQRGYGSFFREPGVRVKAHRFSYEAHKGPVGDLCVLHKCDTPACVNPDHLFLGTHKENMNDRDSKGRGNQPSGGKHAAALHPELFRRLGQRLGASCDHKGEANGRAKLTVNDVLAIRLTAPRTRGLAKQYGVNRITIRKIRDRKLWSHIP